MSLIRRVTVTVAALLTLVPLALTAGPAMAAPPGQAETGTRLTDTVALYPRAIRLAHGPDAGTIVVGVVTFDGPQGLGAIFHSTDAGRSFARVGTVTEPGAARGLCCATLYELPRRVGSLPAGTLLWSASVGQDAGPDRRMSLPVYASSDAGRTWRRLATIATSPNAGGLWEPEFTVSPDGRLIMVVSDESQQPRHSQTLVLAESADAVTWSPLRTVVAAADPDLRPGMPVVRQMPDGTYLMSYEICGPGQDCQHRFRISPDGVDWGSPADLGRPVIATDRTQFRHAPTITWYDDGSPRGRLLAVGQVLVDRPTGEPAAGNGATILHTTLAPSAPWRTAEAPVQISAPYNNYCPNYSSTLLAMPERGELLEVATAYDAAGVCTAYVGIGALPSARVPS